MSELQKVLERFGYKLEGITRFKHVDRIRISNPRMRLVISLRGHVEDFALGDVLEGLLSTDELRTWRAEQK